jgi:hypothetical protein
MLVIRKPNAHGLGTGRPTAEAKSERPGRLRTLLRRFLKALLKALGVPAS